MATRPAATLKLRSIGVCFGGDPYRPATKGRHMPHHWEDCRPAVASIDGKPDPAEMVQMRAAVELTWSELTDAEKQAFHRVCCHNSRTREDLETLAGIQAAIMARVGNHGRPR